MEQRWNYAVTMLANRFSCKCQHFIVQEKVYSALVSLSKYQEM